ncbi:hypothetical protein ACQP1G_36510 [Nocardia sp. CA-107356]|uniref:hypothetical protein n=1 Tax=Nocardia sp. CA-107356 TaxID=3239972 RepID=UPI003D90245F
MPAPLEDRVTLETLVAALTMQQAEAKAKWFADRAGSLMSDRILAALGGAEAEGDR